MYVRMYIYISEVFDHEYSSDKCAANGILFVALDETTSLSGDS